MTTQWILELIDKISSPLDKATEAADGAAEAVDKVDDVIDGLGKTSETVSGKLEKLGKGMFLLNQLKEGVDTIRESFNDAIEPGIRFETAVAEMAGITNMEGKELDVLADKARSTAKAFGADAADATELYTNLLSKLSPELKKAPDALQIMSDNVMTLSKTMKGDVAGATDAMTTAMNQFGISMDDPAKAAQTMTEYMNIMAAGNVEGSASVTQVAAALEKVGLAAHTFGVSFAEVNSAIQVLDKAGKKGSEGGIALNNVISKLEYQTPDAVKKLMEAGVSIDTLKNRSLSLSDRLRSLSPVMKDASVMTSLFGTENMAAAMALVIGTDQMDTWTEAIQGTTAATDMAAKQMDTYAEKQKRMQAFIDDLKISFFEFVEPIAPVIEVVGMLVGGIVTLGMVAWSVGNIMSLVSMKAAIAWVAGMTRMVIATVTSSSLITTSIYSIPIIGWVALIIGAITALVAFLWNKFAEVRAFFYGLWNFIKVIFTEYYRFIFSVMEAILDVINPANWFDDDFHFSDVWDRLSKQAVEGGKKVGSAFSDGWKEGMADFEKSQTKEGQKIETGKLNLNAPLAPINQQAGGNGGNGGASGTGKTVGLGGSGGGNVRNVTMNVTFNNNFQVTGGSKVREIADTVKREILAVLTDSVSVAG